MPKPPARIARGGTGFVSYSRRRARFRPEWFLCPEPRPWRTFVGIIAPLDAPREAFFIDRFEVTNRQYKDFVDQGGYEKREYWKVPFSKNGRSLSWEEAVGEFRDATGRPGHPPGKVERSLLEKMIFRCPA